MKLKISRWTPKESPDKLECSCVDIKCLVVFQKLFYFFYPFFKPLKTSLKFRFTPALSVDRDSLVSTGMATGRPSVTVDGRAIIYPQISNIVSLFFVGAFHSCKSEPRHDAESHGEYDPGRSSSPR